MTAPVPTDVQCSTWETWVCRVQGHGYHDSHNPCPQRPTPHVCGLDLSARYELSTLPGVAVRVLGPTWETREVPRSGCYHDEDDVHDDFCGDPETEEVPSETMVRVVMVGDDRPWDVDRDDLTELADGASCDECGQVGCTHDGRER